MDKENVITDLKLSSKDQIFDFLSQKAKELNIASDSDKIKNDLLEREKIMSTALVEPLAIPHAKSSIVNKNTIIFLRLNQSIDWEGVDVKIVIGIFSKSEGGDHIETLANLSRKLVDKEFIKFLETENRDKIYEKLKDIGE